MPTKKSDIAEQEMWSAEDERIGNHFLEILKKYAGKTMSEKFCLYRNEAAREVNEKYTYYNQLPDGAKKFISSLGGKKSRSKPKTKSTEVKPKSQKELWFDDLKANESMQHGLHPEDEAHIIDGLSKSD